MEKKSADMKRQKKKQDALVYKMLPKEVVTKINSGGDTAENFESSTVFFSTVVDFAKVAESCQAMEVIGFLNQLYRCGNQLKCAKNIFENTLEFYI